MQPQSTLDVLPSPSTAGPSSIDPPSATSRPVVGATAQGQRGMTLIEIMIVVAIISLIMGGVGLVAFQRFQAAQLDTARNNALQQQQLVEQYMIQKRGKCPKSWQDLVKANIATKVLKDPWGNEFVLKCEGGKVEVSSAGPDGEPGTDDDIFATDETPSQKESEEEQEE